MSLRQTFICREGNYIRNVRFGPREVAKKVCIRVQKRQVAASETQGSILKALGIETLSL